MDNKILYTAKFTHHDLKFHKVWWKQDKRCGRWSGQTDGQTDRFLYTPPLQTMFAGGIKIILHIEKKTCHAYSYTSQSIVQGSYTFFVRKFHDFSRTFPGLFLVFPGPTLSKLSTSISEILSNHIIYHVLTFVHVYEYIRNYPS